MSSIGQSSFSVWIEEQEGRGSLRDDPPKQLIRTIAIRASPVQQQIRISEFLCFISITVLAGQRKHSVRKESHDMSDLEDCISTSPGLQSFPCSRVQAL